MSDMFHKGIPDEYIQQVATVMLRADHHMYQILTKRPERLKQLLPTWSFPLVAKAPYIWWGVSVEDRKHGLPRVKILQESIARNKFLSIEPLLEDLGQFDLSGIGWVIVGAESGYGARPMQDDWVRSIRDQCLKQNIPFFFKQRAVGRKKIATPELDGRRWVEAPKWPQRTQAAFLAVL
jgi:protein gp37